MGPELAVVNIGDEKRDKRAQCPRCPAVATNVDSAFDPTEALLQAVSAEGVQIVHMACNGCIGWHLDCDIENLQELDEILCLGKGEWLVVHADEHRRVEAQEGTVVTAGVGELGHESLIIKGVLFEEAGVAGLDVRAKVACGSLIQRSGYSNLVPVQEFVTSNSRTKTY